MLIHVGKVVTGKQVINDAVISILDDKIQSVVPFSGQSVDESYPEFVAIPGLIDNHIHGGYGIDLMFASKEQLKEYSIKAASEGCTAYLPTFAAGTNEVYLNGLKTIQEYCQGEQHGAAIVGVHLEGPFLNPAHAGIQPEGCLIEPDMDLLKGWIEPYSELVKIVTLAPELEGSMEAIEYLTSKGVVTSAGHTCATQAQLQEAKSRGLSRITHLCNAMSQMHHRELGVLGGGLCDDDITAEMVGFDGKTIKTDMWNMIFKLKGKEKIVLSTDGTTLKGCSDGKYIDMGREVEVIDGVIHMNYQGESTFPGFPLAFNHNIRNIISLTKATLEDVVTMACVNPAKEIGLSSQKGMIDNGYDADIVLLNNEFSVIKVLRQGKVIYNT